MKYPQRYLIKSMDLYTQLLWHLPLYDKSGSHQSLHQVHRAATRGTKDQDDIRRFHLHLHWYHKRHRTGRPNLNVTICNLQHGLIGSTTSTRRGRHWLCRRHPCDSNSQNIHRHNAHAEEFHGEERRSPWLGEGPQLKIRDEQHRGNALSTECKKAHRPPKSGTSDRGKGHTGGHKL